MFEVKYFFLLCFSHRSNVCNVREIMLKPHRLKYKQKQNLENQFHKRKQNARGKHGATTQSKRVILKYATRKTTGAVLPTAIYTQSQIQPDTILNALLCICAHTYTITDTEARIQGHLYRVKIVRCKGIAEHRKIKWEIRAAGKKFEYLAVLCIQYDALTV